MPSCGGIGGGDDFVLVVLIGVVCVASLVVVVMCVVGILVVLFLC